MEVYSWICESRAYESHNALLPAFSNMHIANCYLNACRGVAIMKGTEAVALLKIFTANPGWTGWSVGFLAPSSNFSKMA